MRVAPVGLHFYQAPLTLRTITKKGALFLHRQHCMDQRVKHEIRFHSTHSRQAPIKDRSRRSSTNSQATTGRRSGTARGAVRLTAAPPVHRRQPDLRYWLKVSAGLMFATGGVLMATTSTGTVDHPGQTHAALLPVINFNFTDPDDALGTPVTNRPARAESAGQVDPAKQPAKRSDTPVTIALAAPVTPAAGTDAESPPAEPVKPEQLARKAAESTSVNLRSLAEPATDDRHPPAAAAPKTDRRVETITVAAGDTLSGILNRQGVGLASIRKLLRDATVSEQLAHLSIGQTIEIRHTASGRFASLSTRMAADQRIVIERDGDEFTVAAVDIPLDRERVVTSGTIQNSLYLAAAEADLKQSTIMALADIFQWELDFARDIRKGDRFALVYDRLYRDGEYIGDGDILAAEFIRGGRTYQAVRFTDDQGNSDYYSPDGHSMRRTFLRHPVDVVRVTSRFNPNRLHPVLHQIRAHRGVDYGSPYGTPIRATADGTISYAGPQSTYGNVVILQHGHQFSTLYAHMSKVAGKSVTGGKVRQGDIIGYVGNTGRVTGTHLHYEFRVNGVHVDPLKVELPAAQPIAAEYRDALRQRADEMIAQIETALPTDGHQLATR